MENIQNNVIHPFDNQSGQEGFNWLKFTGILILVAVVGVAVGFAVSNFTRPTGTTTGNKGQTVDKTAGIADKKTFKDKVEGILKEGGIDGEGNFHIERPGGVSQNAYLTSSTVDLSQYVGKKVRVWGQTFQGQKAGWLMDVGYVEVIN
jgi:hypothetical protein